MAFRLSTLERLAKPSVLQMLSEDEYVEEKLIEEIQNDILEQIHAKLQSVEASNLELRE